MFSLVSNHLKVRIIVFSLSLNEPFIYPHMGCFSKSRRDPQTAEFEGCYVIDPR